MFSSASSPVATSSTNDDSVTSLPPESCAARRFKIAFQLKHLFVAVCEAPLRENFRAAVQGLPKSWRIVPSQFWKDFCIDNEGIPATIRYPGNLVIIGTVNMDETTHGISDKVLDRAFTIEFWDIDLDSYPRWSKRDLSIETETIARALMKDLMGSLKPARMHLVTKWKKQLLARCSGETCSEARLVKRSVKGPRISSRNVFYYASERVVFRSDCRFPTQPGTHWNNPRRH